MVDEPRKTAGQIVIRLEGAFDAIAAWSVFGRLEQLPSEANIVLDFSQVRDCFDLGVAVIASTLASLRGPRVQIRGLRRHQRRIFRHFGTGVGALRGVDASGDAAARPTAGDRRVLAPPNEDA